MFAPPRTDEDLRTPSPAPGPRIAPRTTRRRFLLGALGLGAAAAGGAAYARWFEPGHLRISRHTVTLGLQPSDTPLRLLHASDLHASDDVPLEYIQHAAKLGVAERPDVICLTGDFVTRHEAIPPHYADVLRIFSDAAPTFATLGNHDGGAWTGRHGGAASSDGVRAVLAAARIVCLHNRVTEISLRGRRLQLIGLGDLWSGECRPGVAFAPFHSRPSADRVVLSHNPDSKTRLLPFAWSLLLSGHTHGGQVGLPFLARRFAPVADKRFLGGLYRWENRSLHVSRGVGCLFGIRFNCRPEISLLTLR